MNILKELEGCRNIGISGHERPDGDCVGSCCALYLYLKKAIPAARIDVFLENFSDNLMKNIPGAEAVRNDFQTDIDAYDAFVVLDTGKERSAGAEALFDRAKKKINIDHHISNRGTGEINLIDGSCSSACELLYSAMDDTYLDAEIAQALYVGMVTDTGVFRYSNTGASTMELAGKLMSYGFDFSTVVQEVFFEKTFLQQKVMGHALMNMEQALDGRFVYCRLGNDILRQFGTGKDDLEGISSQLFLTAGADCAVFMHEDEPFVWRVSMRSGNAVNVAEVASVFGGGGHIRAAGCYIRENPEAALREMIRLVQIQLQSNL